MITKRLYRKSKVTVPSWILKQRQLLPLDCKIRLSEMRIRQWYDHWRGQVYVAFSGGKDSTVLLDLVRSIYPQVPAVFADTGMEFPEIRAFVKSVDNVVWTKPKMTFRAVIEKYGYPLISKENAQKLHEIRTTKSSKLLATRLGTTRRGLPQKWRFLMDAPFMVSHRCCYALKKSPFKRYENAAKTMAYVGIMASDSAQRRTSYMMYGCNAFSAARPVSHPLAVWHESDIWEYINQYGLSYCSIYDSGWNRTGCIFCGFGCHLEPQPGRFVRLKETHPKLWSYCMDKLGMREVLEYIGVPYE